MMYKATLGGRAADGRITNQTIELRTPWLDRDDPEHCSEFVVTLRFDDRCNNGHETFSATCSYPGGGGAAHEEIVRHFPKLEPFIKWHLTSTDGPLHYPANALFHAGDRDHHGLLKGEERQIRNGKSGLPAWKLEATRKLPKYEDSADRPLAEATLRYVPWMRVGEGKERDLDAARHCAVWPEAIDEVLELPRKELERLLMERLPSLLYEFREAMITLGFEYPDPEMKR